MIDLISDGVKELCQFFRVEAPKEMAVLASCSEAMQQIFTRGFMVFSNKI